MSHTVTAYTLTVDLTPKLQETTLYSRLSYKDEGYGRSAFNFMHGMRSDNREWLRLAHNYAELLYGSISIGGDTDWFCVSMGGEDPSRIKDLGALDWSDVSEVPPLSATPRTSSGLRFPGEGESFESSSEGRVTRVESGHLYVVHIKNRESDRYAMFRVDSLKPSDNCTISWKEVPSPEQ
jgi:hypothetical protein